MELRIKKNKKKLKVTKLKTHLNVKLINSTEIRYKPKLKKLFKAF